MTPDQATSSVPPQEGSVSLPTPTPGSQPAVLPRSPVVILRESDLDCDLATAVARVRAEEGQQRSRILIVGPDEESKGAQGESPVHQVPPMPTSISQVARASAAAALQGAAAGLAPKLASLGKLEEEFRTVLSELRDVAEEGSRAQMLARIQRLEDVLRWQVETRDDLDRELDRIAQGSTDVDLEELLREVQLQVESFFPGLRVNMAAQEQDLRICGRAAELCEGLYLAVALTAQRIRGRGSVNIESRRDGGVIKVVIRGYGEPVAVASSEQQQRCREVLVEGHGGYIRPDELGAAGTGMVIDLPIRPV